MFFYPSGGEGGRIKEDIIFHSLHMKIDLVASS